MPQKNYLSAAFIIAALTVNCAVKALCQDCMEKMNTNIARITQKIDRLFSDDWLDTIQAQAIRAGTQETDRCARKQEPKISQENDTVTVTLQLGKGITSIDASIKNNQLFVEIPEKNQKIFLDYEKESNYLSIAIGQSEQKKEEKKGAQREAAFFSSIQHGQTLNQPIEFDKAKVKYENETLTISLPKVATKQKKAPKKITVEIKK